jgi:hypothetical protein
MLLGIGPLTFEQTFDCVRKPECLGGDVPRISADYDMVFGRRALYFFCVALGAGVSSSS